MDDLELEQWHGEAVSAWRERWALPALRIFRRVGSTNDVARDLAEAGHPPGSLVLADEQTRGRGQHGRPWNAPAGASLSMSMIVRPRSPLEGRVLTLRLGIAAARAIEAALPLPLGLKWPNDLVALQHARRGGKVGGILCEAAAAGHRIAYVVAGIGLNLRRPDGGWGTGEMEGRATSLEEAAGSTAAPPDLAGRIAAAWLAVARTARHTLEPAERAEFDRRDVLRGRDITVEGRPAGVADGVTETGALRVRTATGTAEILAGTVRTTELIPDERP